MRRRGNPLGKRSRASSLCDHNPQFSPDGKKIAFVSHRSGSCPEIWVSDRDASNTLQLTTEVGGWQGTPRWSPDGRWIAFDWCGDDGHCDICVMDANGGQRRRVTPFPSDETVPNWSQDGKTLYYLKSPSPGPLFARLLAGGPELQIISDGIRARAFYPVEDGIYYIGPGEKRGMNALKLYSQATGRSQVLTTIEGSLGLGLALSPDRNTVLFSSGQTRGADLMLIENLR